MSPQYHSADFTLLMSTLAPHITGRQVLYHQSAWDAASDDAAIATDKIALSPGIKADFVNYTSYTRGLNGIMVDIQDLPRDPSASDFAFKVGNSSDVRDWVAGPAPDQIAARLNTTSAFTALKLITPSMDAGPILASIPTPVLGTPNSSHLQFLLSPASAEASGVGRLPGRRLAASASGAAGVRLAVRAVCDGLVFLLAEGIAGQTVGLEMYQEGEGWIEAPLDAEPVGHSLHAWSIDPRLWGESRLFRLADSPLGAR